jgi:acyl-CoA synthetase (AMP-forming)/AMP-acid ligase II
MDRGFANMARGLLLSAARYPHKPALVEIDRLTLNYRELRDGAIRLAHRLLARGVGKGDHVAILSGNSVEHMVALYATSFAGAVQIALDPKWTAREVAQAVEAFDCRIIIADEALGNALALLPPGAPPCGVMLYRRHAGRCELLDETREESAVPPQVAVSDHDVCTIVLTSGTTGFPKGVIRTHRNVEIGCLNGALGKGQSEEGRELAVVPTYYGSGRGSVVGQIFLGATVYILPSFDAERAARIISDERITAVAMAPPMCRRLLQVPRLERFDFRSLTSLRKAGSPFSMAMATEIIERVTPNIYQGYASTETGSVTLLRPGEQIRKIGSSGRLEWGVETRLATPDGEEAAPGAEGEITVRGPNVCVGYYENPEEEAKAFRDGWFRTGDIGRFDDEGYLWVVGRIKDMIKTGSISVSPREIENVILSLSTVEDAAVVGVPDAEWGEAVKAFVTPRPGAAPREQDILAHCRARLAAYKIPKSITFVEAIERNGLGKVTQEFKARAR